MPLKILIFALAAFFTISPVSKAIAATEFVTDDTALWTTTDTSTSTSATTSSLTTDSISMDASTSSTSQATSTPGFQSARHGYDELDRLKWTQYEDGTVISYVYDKVGNRTAKNTDAGTLAGFTITAITSGYGSIIPSGTITVASGNGQTFFIEQGIPPNGTGCPSGYAFVTANNRCEKAPPDCPSGYSFNPASNQCEQIVTSSYQASCNAGQGTLNADAGTCEYTATATTIGGVNFDIPVYYCNNGYNYLYSTNNIPGATCSLLLYGYAASSAQNLGSPVTIFIDTSSLGLFYVGATTFFAYGSTTETTYANKPLYKQRFHNLAGTVYPSLPTPYGYISASNGIQGEVTTYSCPNGGAVSGTTCQNSPVCPSGGTLSGSTCYVSTTNVATPSCSYGTLDSPSNRCYYYLPGTLTGFIVDDVAVSLGTLPSMQGPTGRRYYYTFANVAANHAITANFTDASSPPCIDYPARLAGATPANFLSLQSAYNAAASSDTIQGNMYDHFESLLLNRNISVTLDGGYSCDFSTMSGNLTVKGAMTIANGSVIVNGNIILAAP